MKVKICGLCRPVDAAVAAEAGADYLGVILVENGPRRQSVAAAQRIFEAAPGCVRVGVFADQSIDEIAAAAIELRLSVVQLHGSEAPGFIKALALRVPALIWKAIWMDRDLNSSLARYRQVAQGVLLDGGRSGHGGTGTAFDWQAASAARDLLPENIDFIAAGGLNPENVAGAVAVLKPTVVDVASGVESRIGEKSRERILSFMKNAKT